MGELEDRISSVLNDPEQFNRIAAMAKSIMGGEGAEQGSEAKIPLNVENIFKAGMGAPSESLKMLETMKPCLSDKRRRKMEKALTLARLARFAGFAVNNMEDENV